jgi:hypothetical protein
MKRLTYLTVCLALLLCLTPVTKAQGTSNYDALVQQGNSQLQAGNNEQALASAKTAIKTNANRWEAYAIAGGALLNLKRYEEAVDQFSHAIDRAPQAKQEGLRALRKECVSTQPAGPQSAVKPSHATPPGATTAVAQQGVLPPPGPTDSGPSLAVTMQFIQDKLNDRGKVHCIVYYQSADGRSTDTQNDMCGEGNNVTANSNECTISYGGDPGFSLREVQNIETMSVMQYMSKYVTVPMEHYLPGVAAPITLYPVSVTPSITMIVAQGSHNKELQSYYFNDANMADRVAKAMTHAVELCGGGNRGKDPF